MVLRAVEGWENRQHPTYVQRLWTGPGFVPSVALSDGRKVGSSGNATNYGASSVDLVSSDENIWIIGFGYLVTDGNNVGGSATGGVRLQDSSGTEQIALVLQPGSDSHTWKFELRRGANVLATTIDYPAGNGPRSWQYFQLKVTVRAGANGAYELRRWSYGESVHTVEFSATGLDCADTGTDGARRFEYILNSGSGPAVRMDDITVMDSTGALNKDFTSEPLIVLGIVPEGDGALLDWTPSSGGSHYQMVDDPRGGPPADSEFVQSAVIADQDTYLYGDLSDVVGAGTAVLGIQIVTTAKMITSGSLDLAPLVRSAAVNGLGSNFTVDSLVIKSFLTIMDQNPVGPAAWTKATVDAAEFGTEVRP